MSYELRGWRGLRWTFLRSHWQRTTVPGDHRSATKAAAKPERANPTDQGIDADRGVADFTSNFAFEVPLNAASSAAYGSLPRFLRPGSSGPGVRPSPSCDVSGFQWRGAGGGLVFQKNDEKETKDLQLSRMDWVVGQITNWSLVPCSLGGVPLM